MTERDPVVAAALASRTVPDHAPRFWDDLAATLAASGADTVDRADGESDDGEGDDDAKVAPVVPLAAARSPWSRRRWLTLATAVAAAAAVVAVIAVAVVPDDAGDEFITNPSDPTTAPATTGPPTVSTLPPISTLPPSTGAAPTSGGPVVATTPPITAVAPPADLGAFPGVWPYATYADVAPYLAAASTQFADPTVIVQRFAAEVVGVVDPAVSEFVPTAPDGLEGTVEVRTRTESGSVNTALPPTRVTVRRVGDDTEFDPAGPWVVTGATSEDVTIDSPATGTAVSSPLAVTGTGAGYEGTVVVSLHSSPDTIMAQAPTIAGNPDPAPWSVELTYDDTGEYPSLMLMARTDSGAEFVHVPAFAVVRLTPRAADASAGPRAVVHEFLDAISAGDADVAWALLDPSAQEATGGRAAFDAAMAAGLSEGLGAFAALPDEAYFVRQSLGAPTEAGVVTLAGDVTREGTTEFSAWAFPVTQVDGEFRIAAEFDLEADPAVDAVGWVGGTVSAGEPLDLLIPTNATELSLAVDANAAVAPTETVPDQPQSAVTFPLPDLTPGPHVATLSFIRADGLPFAEARVLEVVP